MPYAIEKRGSGYSVVNKATGAAHSKHTSHKKAAAQMRLLHAVDNGYEPTGDEEEPMGKPDRFEQAEEAQEHRRKRRRRLGG